MVLIDDLIAKLKKIATTKIYRGELSDLYNIRLETNNLPIIFIDFVGDNFINRSEKELLFNIYIAHISYSKSEKNRKEKNLELFELIEKIDKIIWSEYPKGELVALKKLFDARSKNGYLTIFMRHLKVVEIIDLN